jgi:hypothetical protein
MIDLRAPCWVITCDGCGADDNGDFTPHYDSFMEAVEAAHDIGYMIERSPLGAVERVLCDNCASTPNEELT